MSKIVHLTNVNGEIIKLFAMSDRTNPMKSVVDVLRMNTILPPAKRNPRQISNIMEAIQEIKYFSFIVEAAGSKILYEYAKHLELIRVSANIALNDLDRFYIVLAGKVLCRNKDANLRQYADGQEIGQLGLHVQYVTQQDSYLLTMELVYYRKLITMERNAQSNQKKRFNPPKEHDENAEIFANFKRAHFFGSIPTYDLRELAIASKTCLYPKGQVVYEQGKFPLCLYFVLKGGVSLQYTEVVVSNVLNRLQKKKVRQAIMSIVNELEVFGLEQILNEQVYNCTATPQTESIIICIPSEAFNAIINPIYSKGIYDKMVALVSSKRSLFEKSRHSNNIYKESMREMMNNDTNDNTISQRLQELSHGKGDNKALLRSKIQQKNYKCYIPSGIMHTNLMTPKFYGTPEDLNLGLLENQMRKTGSRTLSPLRQPRTTRLQSSDLKNIYERFIINKLEHYENMDKSKFVDIQAIEYGSTINFFNSNRRSPIQQKPIKTLSVSFNRPLKPQLGMLE